MFKTPSLEVRSRRIRTLVGAGIGLVAGLLLVALRPLRMMDIIELRLIDLQTRALPLERPPDDRIVLCEILEADVEAIMEAFGVRWPWDLDLTSYPFRIMADAGARAVMLDIYQLDRGAGPDDVPRSGELPAAMRQLLALEAEHAQEYREALQSIPRCRPGLRALRRPRSTRSRAACARAGVPPRLDAGDRRAARPRARGREPARPASPRGCDAAGLRQRRGGRRRHRAARARRRSLGRAARALPAARRACCSPASATSTSTIGTSRSETSPSGSTPTVPSS